jgi:hypothetical protein
MTAPSCTECGQPVTAAADRAGNLTYIHAEPAADGHQAAVAAVTVTYRHEGIWTDVSCDELGGHLGTVTDQEAAKALAWTCLRRLRPPRGVIERHEGART